ncbi:MAG: hypothetical protein H7312_20360 [Tardiphaga sp.]|nr:hypothetical protein [Tardiphaga sp.]
MAGFITVIRNTVAELAGRSEPARAGLPAGLPDAVRCVALDSVMMLTGYQSPGYAQLYCDRLRRFVGRRGVDHDMFCEIARLLAIRMSYHDAIRIAQLKLQEMVPGGRLAAVDVRRFRLDELVSALPEIAGEPLMWALEWIGCAHRTVPIRFSTASWLGVRRLQVEASLRRWRLLSVRYATERAWVERWLHMIDRALTKRPEAAAAIVQTATMIEGYGTGYRHGVAAWHQIIDGLAKPVFDGTLVIADLDRAIAEARQVPLDPKGARLRDVIADLRTRSIPAPHGADEIRTG